jgi:sterol desaturase/sphingolipid hydroxylase (fatty acid hydroxylase superfamily)
VNLGFSLLAVATATLVVRPAFLRAMGWSLQKGIGMLGVLALPAPMEVVLAFALLDLTFYYWHMANHRLRLLWRFHVVHHMDPELDVTTALRFHFGEVALSSAVRALQVVLIGAPFGAYLVYELAFQANTLFHHSNLRLPLALERQLNWLLVTPRMHGIHHSRRIGETNSNYSVVLPWWDWLHRSLQLGVPQREIEIGARGYTPGDNRFWKLLLVPFRAQPPDPPDAAEPSIGRGDPRRMAP